MKKLKWFFHPIKTKIKEMKNNKLFLATICIMASSILLTSCKKDEKLLATETYKLVGKIDPSRTTITTASLTKAEFTVSYNNANSFGGAQSLINGSLALTGYTGITGRDTLSFFSTQALGPVISLLPVPTTAVNTTSSTVYYSYFNGSSATFSINNFPFTNEGTAALKEGKGYFRIGQAPKYVFILLDDVTKL